MTLVEVQQSLMGASAKRLDQLAALPAGFIEEALETGDELKRQREPSRESAVPDMAASTKTRQRFWSDVPEVTRSAAQSTNGPAGETELPTPQLAVILPLDAGVSLLLQGVSPEQLTEPVVSSLRPAVAILRDALVRAGLSQRVGDSLTGAQVNDNQSEE
jgi:hypothetical protein